MPMRFADQDGTMIDVYQATTQMTDESGQSYPATINSLLDGAIGPNGYYGAFTANMHTDSPTSTGSDAIVASALTRGVPIISARQMLTWVDGRNGSSFGSITWGGNTLSFTITPAAGSDGLRAMVPMDAAPGRLTGITQGGNPIQFSTRTIKGVDYAFFPAQSGVYQATYAVDTTPPVISNVVASPQPGGSATITWTTNEPSDSRVDYGTTPGSLTSSASNGASVTSHSVALTGLAAGTTYHFRVRSADAANNASISPPAADPPASFITPLPGLTDTTVADFTAGQADVGSYIGEAGDGEVLLAPATGAEFSGSALPSGWFTTPWQSGGGASVGGGSIVVDGAASGVNATNSPGRVLEFVATFSGTAHQHVGLGVDLNNQPWAIFSTAGGGGLFARTNGTSTQIPGSWLGAPHLFRIDWTSMAVTYFIDGQQVASHTVPIATQMRPLISDFDVGGGNVSVNWMRMTPYATSGTFTSRVFDSGSVTNWGTATWNADVPAGTTQALSVRTGNSPTPDATWSNFTPLASSGSSVGASTRYLQYRVTSTTSNSSVTPTLRDISFQVSSGPPPPDTTPPTITNVNSAPAANGTTATITWTTDEPSSSRVDYGTSAGSLNLTTNDPALVASHSVALTGLTPGTTYFFRVRSTDAAANAATSPIPANPPATFTTPIQAAPVITAVVATPGNDGATAVITWTTDTASDSRVDYGTAAGSLTSQVNDTTLVTSHSIALTGLNAGTTYFFRVRSANSQGIAAVSPAQTDPPAQFVTPVVTRTDTMFTEFNGGTTGSNTYVSQTQNGEVILRPARGAEFTGTTIPSQWTATLWQTGGSATVGQGVVTMDGARVGTSTTFGTGRTVEFVATFSGQADQNAGFGTNFSNRPWATFGTTTGGALYARSSVSTTNQHDTLIPGNWIGSPHLFRVDWGTNTVTFLIDGVQVAQHTRTITTNMRPLASDLTLGSGGVVVDWMRMSPYSSSGTFTRVLDAGSSQRWDTVSWLSDIPAGTTMVVSVRTGNTPTPGTGWTSFRTIATSGGSINLRARYLQYRIQMTRTNAITTPALREISFVIQG
jgi:phosphodiesterase/alkaline phosphatase D-like protein